MKTFAKLLLLRTKKPSAIDGKARRRGFARHSAYLLHGVKSANIGLDRKVLSDIAIVDPKGFEHIVKSAKGRTLASRQSKRLASEKRVPRFVGRPRRAGL
jgi:hypothetical protein